MDSFKDRLLDALKKLLTSSKFITAIAGLVVAVAARRGVVLNPEDVQAVLLIFSVLVGAQGLNDLGKGKAQVEAVNPKPPDRIEQTVTVEAQPKEPPQ